MNVIGSPSCIEIAGECTDDARFQSASSIIPVGDVILVNRYQDAPESGELYVGGRITAAHGVGGDTIYDVEVLPMQKPVNGTYEPCIMALPGAYPADCAVATTAVAFPLQLRNIPKSDLKAMKNGLWCPLNRVLVNGGGQLMEGGVKAAAFGDQYAYSFRQTEGYNDLTSPKYTEFIEVEFKEAVYPVAIELGSPRGAGHVVNLKVGFY